MAENVKLAPSGDARALKWCVIVAGIVAITSIYIAPLPSVQIRLISILPSLVQFVPSVPLISSETSDIEASELILLAQWLFTPAYVIAIFYCFAPWSPFMRDFAVRKSLAFSSTHRTLIMPAGVLVSCAWFLGDLGLIQFPTLYNGKFVYPLSHVAPQLRLIYTSRIAFAIYAWLGPIVEVGLFWMLCTVVINARTYFFPKSVQLRQQ